jgi:cobalt-zinc-cadmium efflux system protein
LAPRHGGKPPHTLLRPAGTASIRFDHETAPDADALMAGAHDHAGGHPDAAPRRHGRRHSHAGSPFHRPAPDTDRRRLVIALALIVGFMAAEVVVGILAWSLVLLADAAHMLTDAGAVAFALVAMRLAARPPGGDFTFGLKRAEILSAQLNGATLLGLAAFIVIEGVHRLIEPPAVEGLAVLVVALVGIVVNLAATWTLASANRRSLNVEGAFRHILTDLVAFVGTAVAGLVVILTGFARADGIAALLVASIMAWGAYGLLRDSGRVLLEAAPKDLDADRIGRAMAGLPAVREVHDLHVWEVTSGFPALSAHVLVAPGDDCHARRHELERLLRERFGIDHTTLQVDHDRGHELLSIETDGEGARPSAPPPL